jgi:predicted permease
LETLIHDIRHGVRTLVRNPGFTLLVALALALGIGANTVVFSVLNAVLFEPLPYPDPDKIVSMNMRFTGIGIPDDRNATSPPELIDVRRFSAAYSDISAFAPTSFNIRVAGLPERIVGATVSAGFFRVLGIDAQLGRTFAPEEEQAGRETVVVLGHALWQRRFGSDPEIIGRSLNLNGRSYTVVGIAPRGFEYPGQAEIWTPIVFTDAQLSPNSRGSHFLSVLARIRPELTYEQALADMDRVSQLIMENAPDYPYSQFNFKVLIRPLLEVSVGTIRAPLMILMGAVGLVLLIACANVANLLMVRASVREREIGIRAALGATRRRLIRQLMTESIILSSIGAVLGLVIASAVIAGLAGLGSDAFPRLADTALDSTTLLFTAVVTLATGVLFGIIPAVHVSQTNTQETLKEFGRGASASGAGQRTRRVLVVTEVALSLALLAGAGLLIKSFMKLQEVDPGFRPEGILTMRVALPQARYSTAEQVRTFYRDLMDRLRALPGVRSVGGINALPLSGLGGSGTTTMDTTAVPPDQVSAEADLRVVTPGYFETMQTPLLAGRMFDDRDNEGGQFVAIVDETLAAAYWPNESAIGKRLKQGGIDSQQPWRTIVGVVRHVRYISLELPSRIQVYVPHAQTPAISMGLAVSTTVAPQVLGNTIQREVMTLDPEQPIFAIQPMDNLLAGSVTRRRIIMTLLAAFSGIALVLAALGIYGVVSYWVTQRSHEIGIRMALGASRGAVLRMVVGQSLSMVVLGVGVGLAASIGVARLIESLLFNVAPRDLTTLGLVSASLLAVGLIAGFVPALRATRVNPIHTLRQE